ncbi:MULTISPECIES: RcnB family protein [unclassified Acinetobacter]|uniref:RcnB family protein n=1 Tax=unclassified Acinetobacter TaxID=196816 RepID=UPI002578C80C|nr:MULTISPECIES: RcnB family protein [unclassified Acinetobacter]MDM1765805.1 RcnB family protein [Acinetobacter sp. 226-1]MDM1769553.1 RcnB family protein [Acinetobacter sp. 226-4]
MKSVLTAIALSLSALVATSAMAAPNDYHRDHNNRYQQNHWDHKNDHRWNNDNRHNNQHNSQYNNQHNNRVNPSREWRSGQYLPSQFSSSRYQVNYKNYRQLPKPSKYQQWYKVNGDYVLVNERNNRIIRIIG